MIIRENGRHREEVYAMWQRNFHDPVPYADFYFTEVYGKHVVLLNVTDTAGIKGSAASEMPTLHAAAMGEELPDEVSGDIRGMLHLNPYELLVRGKCVDANYIVGVATDEEFRRQGVMRELLTDTFARLRNRGEMLTYLMPADENYYLPFDFRFGLSQLEQEIECFGQAPAPEKEVFRFAAGLPENLEAACQAENAAKTRRFAVTTKITPDYLRRMEKEVKSDFGRLVTVYRDGVYAGRFVMGAENDCMVISQIVFVENADGTADRRAFLHEALQYCEREYHYGRYQIVLDETWQDELLAPGNYHGVRVLPVRRKKIIMFRILNLETLGVVLCGDKEVVCRIHVKDAYLPEQEGSYLWNIGKEGSVIRKITDDAQQQREASEKSGEPDTAGESQQAPDGGSISIAALTSFIFGKREDRTEEIYGGLTDVGRVLLDALQPLSPGCIQEIV